MGTALLSRSGSIPATDVAVTKTKEHQPGGFWGMANVMIAASVVLMTVTPLVVAEATGPGSDLLQALSLAAFGGSLGMLARIVREKCNEPYLIAWHALGNLAVGVGLGLLLVRFAPSVTGIPVTDPVQIIAVTFLTAWGGTEALDKILSLETVVRLGRHALKVDPAKDDSNG